MRPVAVMGVMFLGACTLAPRAGMAPLGSDPVVSGGTYSMGGGLIVAVDLRESEGRTKVCGIWAQGEGEAALVTPGPNLEILGAGAVHLGDEALVRGLAFLTEVPRAASYAGAPAGCVISARRWHPGDAARRPVVRFPRKDLHVHGGEAGAEMVGFVPYVAQP